MKRDKDSFALTGPIIIRLAIFLILFIVVNYYLFVSSPSIRDLSPESSILPSAQIASVAAAVLGAEQVSKINNYVNGFKPASALSQAVSSVNSQVSQYVRSELSKFRRQLIDKIYQDLIN